MRAIPWMFSAPNMTGFDIGKVSQLVEPVLVEMGFELVGIEFLSDRGRWILRNLADKEGGITLDDCARASREVGALLDVKEIVRHEYVLEMSSPGLNRPLFKERDFLGSVGKKVKVKMLSPIEGRRHFTGYLKKFEDKTLHMDVDGNLVLLPYQDVEKANIVYEFSK